MQSLSRLRLIILLAIAPVAVLCFILVLHLSSPEVEEHVSQKESRTAQLGGKTEKEGAKTRSAGVSRQQKEIRRKHRTLSPKTPRKRPSETQKSKVAPPSERKTPANLSALSGKVLDVWTAIGIANAELSLLDPRKDLEPLEESHSSADGAFLIKNIPSGFYDLKASAKGYAENFRQVHFISGEKLAGLRIYLEPSYSISGRVTDEKYKPIARAVVKIIGSQKATKAEADGRYTLEVPNGGNHNILFEARGYGFTRLYNIPAGSTDVDVVLHPGASISGKVIDGERRSPVAKARVYVIVQERRPGRTIEPIGIVRTDINGNYTVSDIGAGYYMLWAKHGDTASSVKVVGIRQSEERKNVDLELYPSGSISGRITEKETGDPVPNMPVTASVHLAPYKRTVSEQDGSYKITGLGPGEYSLYMERTCHVVADESPFKENYKLLVASGSDITGIDFILSRLGGPWRELEEPAQLTGRVIDDNGNRIPDARVLLGGSRSTFSDKQGAFFFDNITTDQIRLSAEHSDHGYGWTWLKLKSGDKITNVEIVLKYRQGRISGRVTDDMGHLLPGAHVKILNSGSRKGGITNAEGQYMVFGMIPKGSCDLQAQKEGYEPAALHDVTVRRDELTSGINFQLKRMGGHYIMGKVVDDRDVPIWDAYVTATGASGAKRVRTDFSGEFKFMGLNDNSAYVITVDDWSITGQTVNVGVVQADTADVKVVLKRSTGVIAGRVIKAWGRPIKRFSVQYLNQTIQPPTEGIKELFSERGEFILEGLEAGEYKLTVRNLDNWLYTEVEGVTVEEGQVTSGIVIEIPDGGSVTGVVVDAAGLPIEGAFVSADGRERVMAISPEMERGGSHNDIGLAITESNGTFQIDSVNQARARVAAWHTDYAPREVYVDVVNGETTAGVKIVLTKGGSVRGVVRDKTGAVRSGVDVYTMPPFKHVKADANGSFRIEKLTSMKYWLTAWIRGVRRASSMVQIKEGEEAYVELILDE